MSRPFPFTTELNDAARGRLNDEVMIARELQASGLSRGAALMAAAEAVTEMYRRGRVPGGIVSVERCQGDNGGPILID